MCFQFINHTADIQFRACGKTMNDAFGSAAAAFSSYVSRGGRIAKTIEKDIVLEGRDSEHLLYQFLDRLVYLLDAEHFIVATAQVSITGNTLQAHLLGDSTENYPDLDGVKAATYADMYVKKIEDKWEVQAVLDV